MEIDGTHRFDAPRERVWALLRDPATVTRLIPGVTDLEAVSEREYRGELKVGSGWMKASYDVTVRVVEEAPPGRLVLDVEGSGRFGDASGRLTLDLDESGSSATDVRYAAAMKIGGPAGAMAGSFEGVANQKMKEGLRRLERELE